MTSAMQFLDDVLPPEVSGVLRDQMARRNAAMGAVVSQASALPQSGAPLEGASQGAPPSGPKAWFDRRMADANPAWKVDQLLRDKGFGPLDRLRAARDPAFAASKLNIPDMAQGPAPAAPTTFGRPQWPPRGFTQV